MKPRITQEKRRKELLRKERQLDKAQRRAQRKVDRSSPKDDGLDVSETFVEAAIPDGCS